MNTSDTPTAPGENEPIYVPSAADTDLAFLLSGKGSMQERRAALAALRARDKHALGEWIRKYKEAGETESVHLARIRRLEEALKKVHELALDARIPPHVAYGIIDAVNTALQPPEAK